MIMHMRSIRLALVAGAVLATAGIAQAGTLVDLSKLGPKQQAHLAQIQAQKRAITPMYNYDIRPAVLRRVHVGGIVNVNRKYAEAVVSLTASDNLTGVHQINLTLMSPSGQVAYRNWYSNYDSVRSEVQLGVDMSQVTENGTWRLYAVSVGDSNGNISYYDEAALAAMGPITFMVIGADGDSTAPQAQTGGTNLTPTVSRSTPPRGMLPGNEARVGVQLNFVDGGISGIRSATMEFCSSGDCFYVSGDVDVRGKASATMTLGGHVYSWTQLGDYKPYSLYVYDQAGNASYYYANWDDLDALLDNPVITVTE